MLQEAPANAPLGATGNLSPLDHQFVAGCRQETGRICIIRQSRCLASIRGEDRGYSETLVSQTQGFRYTLVIPIDRVAEGVGVAGNNRVRQFIVMQDGTPARRTMNDVDAAGNAVVQIDGFAGLLIASERNRRNAPTIKTYDRARVFGTVDLIQ